APEPVENLFAVAAFRVAAKRAGLTEVSLAGRQIRFAPMRLPESRATRLARLYPDALYKQAVNTVLVPRPSTARVGGQPLRDRALLDWCTEFLTAMAAEPAVAG